MGTDSDRGKLAARRLARYVAKGDQPCVAILRSAKRPGTFVKLTMEGAAWALDRIANDHEKDWKLENADS